jgi:hypothetical protein
MNVDTLNQKYSQKIEESSNVHFEANSSGLISCLMRHQSGSSCRIYLLGATLTHFSTSKGLDV